MIFGKSNELKMLQVLKISITSRFSRIISSLSFKEEVKALIKIIWYFVILLLYIHVIACFWYYIININKEWIPPFQFIDSTNNILFLAETDTQYATVFYYMVACMGGNEMGPRNSVECVVIVFFMLMAAIINANLFGEMAFLATVISKKSTAY